MNVHTTIVLGAYAQGMLDAAASRGEMTPAAEATLVNGLMEMYRQATGVNINRVHMQSQETDANT